MQMIDLALYLEKEKVLVIADIHLGFEEALNKAGIMLTRTQFKKTIARLENIFLQLKGKEIKTIVINGDLKHEFGKISEQEWDDIIALLEYLQKKATVVLVKGNHDKILGPLAFRQELIPVEKFEVGDYCITHGDKLVKTDKKIIIIGHEHPCVTLTDNVSSEKAKCFLVGAYKKKELVVMPSFNLITEGTDVLKEKLLSPYLKGDLDNFEVFIPLENDILSFGKLKNLLYI